MTGTKLSNIFFNIRFIGYVLLFLTVNSSVYSQNCTQDLDFNFKSSSPGLGINWEQFPEFSLPFKVVYGGTSIFENYNLQSKRGYSHFANAANFSKIPATQRALVFYGVTDALPLQPWHTEKNPWGNDLTVLARYWDSRIAGFQKETGGNNFIDADLMIFDIERQIKSDDSILVLKKSAFTPAEIKSLPNDQFILAYKKELQKLYSLSFEYFQNKAFPSSGHFSSYTDSPVLNTFTNIQGKTWEQWKTQKSALNYLCYDFDKQIVGGSFYNYQTFLTPSAYFYYDYPHPFASEYLSYLLFQIEANRVWSPKEQMLFVWQRYSFNPDYVKKSIKPWMAESMAIFPFMAGAKGIFFWEDPSDLSSRSDFSNYEYFTKGLYRLSKYKEVFDGDYKIIEEFSARDYNENKKPIWRGILNGTQLLVAAQNPYAKSESELVELTIKHGNWAKNITLKGYDVFLCKYDLTLPTFLVSEEPRIVVFPNPSSDFLQILGLDLNIEKVNIEIFDSGSKLVKKSELKTNAGGLVTIEGIKTLAPGNYIIKIVQGVNVVTRKFYINE